MNRSVTILDQDMDTVAAGFLVTPELVVTVAHAVDQTRTFVGCGSTPVEGTLVKYSKNVDLALVRLVRPCTEVEVTPFAPRNADEGSQATFQGYPNGGGRKTMAGTISSYELEDFEGGLVRFVMILDGNVIGGHSGGPVMNAEGQLIAVVSGNVCYGLIVPGSHQPPRCLGITVPLSVVREFLASRV